MKIKLNIWKKFLFLTLLMFFCGLIKTSPIKAYSYCCDRASHSCVPANYAKPEICVAGSTFNSYDSCFLSCAQSCTGLTCNTSTSWQSVIQGTENSVCPDANSGRCPDTHPRARSHSIDCIKNGRISSTIITVCYDKTAAITEGDVYGTISAEISGVNNKSLSDLGTFINKIINFILFLAAVLLFINIVLAGIQIITNGKDPKGFSEAMKKILFSVIGILIAAFAYIIADYVMKLFFGDQTEIFGNTSMQLEIEDYRG